LEMPLLPGCAPAVPKVAYTAQAVAQPVQVQALNQANDGNGEGSAEGKEKGIGQGIRQKQKQNGNGVVVSVVSDASDASGSDGVIELIPTEINWGCPSPLTAEGLR